MFSGFIIKGTQMSKELSKTPKIDINLGLKYRSVIHLVFFFSHIKSKYYGINEELVHQTFRKLLKPVNVVHGQNPYKEIIRNSFLKV